MLIPVSRNAANTALFILHPLAISSCLYFAKKWMVSSTEMPNAMLNTRMVDGFSGIPVNPITPAVIIRGNRLGINEIIIILKDRNRNAIKKAINRIARLKDKIRFLIKYLVPLRNRSDFPVIFTP